MRELVFFVISRLLMMTKNILLFTVENLILLFSTLFLMVVPFRHVSDFTELSLEETSEMTAIAQKAISALKILMNPDGFNMGMNLGKAAGAGIEQHLHLHIVPRWEGDTNFMPIVGEVKVISEALLSTWSRLKEIWPK
jgi:ATP adenylyltransferase